MSVNTSTIAASFDGACEPFNPGGHMGLGWVIGGESHSEYIPASSANTNNVAEYLALTKILEHVTANPEIGGVSITGDSQLVCCQLDGEFAVRSASLVPYYQRASSLITALVQRGCRVRVNWVPRERNVVADIASKAALEQHGIQVVQRKPAAGYTPRLGDIGDKIDPSAVRVGRSLEAAGLRANKMPTDRAIAEGYAQRRFDGFGEWIDWNLERTLNLLRRAS